MRWIRSIVALALAALLALAARSLSEESPDAGPVRRPLVAEGALDPDRVDRIELVREGRRTVFDRTPGSEGTTWTQTEPVVHAADGWAVRQLITRLLKAESVRRVEGLAAAGDASATDAERKALADAGLLPPVATLVLRESPADGGAPREFVVELGRRSLAGRAFARVLRAGDGATGTGGYDVVDSALHEFALERDVRDFRRRELFPDLGEVGRIAFESGGRRVVLVRTKSGFRLEAPVATRADRQQAEELVDALRRARSSGFIVDEPREPSVYGLDPAAARIEIEPAASGATGRATGVDPARRALRIGDAVSIGAQDRFGLVEGTSSVVRVPAAEIAAIVPRVERLIDAVATGVRARDVARIEIMLAGGADPATAPRERIELVREVDGWSATRVPAGEGAAPIVGTASGEAVDRLLAALAETRAGSVEIAAFPQDLRVAEIVLRGFAGEALDTVRVARREGGQTILENGDGVLRVHGSIDLPVSPADLGFTAKAAR
ncbi:MAG: DUF4340 domain-containing protein [Planctomycetaceae bacterium]|nr:DUF4340 domain-containing protein [Planctomycetaceae bacterium]